jgi:excinuclease ABC subunit C
MPIQLLPTPAAELRAQVRASCENRPGVYRMLGPGDQVLYVGRSIRVRTRLLSYFRAERPEKAAEIVAHTHRIDWEYEPSEFASVLRELHAIQAARPPYNVEHKRDRAFCFAKLTREQAPRLMAVLEVTDDGALYFGPFRGRTRVREALREVADLLELRTCAGPTPMRFADQLDLFGADPQPLCMRTDVGKCLGPCAARCTRAEYLAQVELARRFLEGDVDLPLRIIADRMRVASERLQFEYAAQLRDRGVRLADARAELASLRGTIEALSFLYLVPGRDGADRVYVIRRGSVRLDRPAPRTAEERAALLQDAAHIFRRRETGPASVHAGQVAEILLIARWFRLKPEEFERTWQPKDLSPPDLLGDLDDAATRTA